ncbi:MAG: RidA family protein [Caldilineaceae bacterium]|nr:RidA family protein [Caldilineaceae bacterium]
MNAALFERESSVDRHIINTEKAPAAVGPYSQAVRSGSFVFTSGQIGINPLTGQLRIGIEEQARQVLTNLAAVLSASGSGMDRILKTSIFLTDMADFGVVNRIYAEAFDTEPPARSTFQVAALPLGALIEIEAIALVE